jgi:hypothetical protein
LATFILKSKSNIGSISFLPKLFKFRLNWNLVRKSNVKLLFK